MKFILSLIMLCVLASCASHRPIQATDNPVGDKIGKACSKYVLGFHMGGEEFIINAARTAKISKIATVDVKTTGLWPFVWKECVFVNGN